MSDPRVTEGAALESIGAASGSVRFDFWPLGRPMTGHWGSGAVYARISKMFGAPDVAFGKTDGIPDNVLAIDRATGFEWSKLAFEDHRFAFGYWDPPYEDKPGGKHKLFKPEGREIWRTVRRLAILHTHVYPTSWFVGGRRVGMVAVTMGPLKQIRILQVFERAACPCYWCRGIDRGDLLRKAEG